MNQKIAELTEKIYREGVAKAEEESAQIIEKARAQSAAVIAEAKREAERIVAEAQRRAEDLRRNVEAEIRLAGNQAISVLKQRIAEIITARVLDDKTRGALMSPEFVAQLIQTVVEHWKAATISAPTLEVLLPEEQRAAFQKVFESSARNLMSQGIQIVFSDTVKAGFRIGPIGGAFRLSMTDEDFNEFFRQYLRPRTRDFLFGEQEGKESRGEKD